MYGIDQITRHCVYKTPCGWCARLETECKMKCKSIEDECVYYKNGRCMGTKEMDLCKGTKCGNFKIK